MSRRTQPPRRSCHPPGQSCRRRQAQTATGPSPSPYCSRTARASESFCTASQASAPPSAKPSPSPARPALAR
eukprot:13973251-Alexandrium_andersonii.AAC.1